jgi:hypothetical protein
MIKAGPTHTTYPATERVGLGGGWALARISKPHTTDERTYKLSSTTESHPKVSYIRLDSVQSRGLLRRGAPSPSLSRHKLSPFYNL